MKVFIRIGCYGNVPGTTVNLDLGTALHLIRHGFADQVDDVECEIYEGVYADEGDEE